MNTRHIPLEGVGNFRDFGGYATASGRKLKSGRLYRSAHHAMATDADLDAVHALDIAVIVDLRRGEERERMPSRRHAAFAGRVIENDTDEAIADPWMEFVRGSDGSAAAFRGYMDDYYRNAPYLERHIDLFRRYFQALADAEGPVLIHCAAGKDRTGLLAALTHQLMGVQRDDIFEDFLLTNTMAGIEQRLPQVMQMIEEQSGHKTTEAAARVAMAVDAAYLEAAFAAIAESHGGLEAYIERELGVDAALRKSIEARLLD